MAFPAFIPARNHDFKSRTSASITLNGTSWANVDTGLDIVLDANVDDVIYYGFVGVIGNEAVDTYFDVATIVSAAVVNYFGGSAETATGEGVSAWWSASGTKLAIGGEAPYTIVSGDLSSGTVTLRLRYRQASATNRTLLATTTSRLRVYARNFGPVRAA